MVLNCLNRKILPLPLNETLLVLIPKMNNPKTLIHFRPISLCNVLYKIITKVIVNRLKPLLLKVMDLKQTSFILGRNITSNIIIYQKVLHTFRRKKGIFRDMLIKLDLEKAYDRLEWPFIKDTLL